MEEEKNDIVEGGIGFEESTTAFEDTTDVAAVDIDSNDVEDVVENVIQTAVSVLHSEMDSHLSLPIAAIESVEAVDEAMEGGAEAMEDTEWPVENEFMEEEKDEKKPEVCPIRKSKEESDPKAMKDKLGADKVIDSDQTQKPRFPILNEYIDVRARALRLSGTAQFPEIFFKKASAVSRDPRGPAGPYSAAAPLLHGVKGVCNRLDVETVRRHIQECRNLCANQYQPNPTCSVPMRAKVNDRRFRVKKQNVEEWRVWEERDRDKRDHELAIELGYETLVGNILYIDIPGGRDINRSWHSFLSEDVMEWGFPYKKGSIERPRMKLPEPYLAHQMREKLWKFPRSRTLQPTQED